MLQYSFSYDTLTRALPIEPSPSDAQPASPGEADGSFGDYLQRAQAAPDPQTPQQDPATSTSAPPTTSSAAASQYDDANSPAYEDTSSPASANANSSRFSHDSPAASDPDDRYLHGNDQSQANSIGSRDTAAATASQSEGDPTPLPPHDAVYGSRDGDSNKKADKDPAQCNDAKTSKADAAVVLDLRGAAEPHEQSPATTDAAAMGTATAAAAAAVTSVVTSVVTSAATGAAAVAAAATAAANVSRGKAGDTSLSGRAVAGTSAAKGSAATATRAVASADSRGNRDADAGIAGVSSSDAAPAAAGVTQSLTAFAGAAQPPMGSAATGSKTAAASAAPGSAAAATTSVAIQTTDAASQPPSPLPAIALPEDLAAQQDASDAVKTGSAAEAGSALSLQAGSELNASSPTGAALASSAGAALLRGATTAVDGGARGSAAKSAGSPTLATTAGSASGASPSGAQAAAADQGTSPVTLSQADRVRLVQRVEQAFQSVGDQGGSVRLRLSPPDLGSLRIEITVNKGEMTAHVEAETPAARNLLLDNLPGLRDRLAQHDIKIQHFDVDLMDRSTSGANQQAPQYQDPNYRPPQSSSNRISAGDSVEPTPAAAAASGLSTDGSRLNVIV
jgi:flagellar hook-length control protein FliK